METIEEKVKDFASKFQLSPREADVLYQLILGKVRAEKSAVTLNISPNTVRIHLKNINLKVGCASKAEVLSKFIRFCLESSMPATTSVAAEA